MSEGESCALVVDDDAAVRQVLVALLRQDGLRAIGAKSADEALALLERGGVDVIISDVRMPGMDGLTLLRRSSATWPDIPVVLLTAHGTIPLAVEAMKAGAHDFLSKPFEREEVLFVVRKALLAAEHAAGAASEGGATQALLGQSPALREVQDRIRRAAGSAATVLIRGETGSGKELVARAIHDASARSARPFVKLNCAALPETLLESELFGHEKGAFTGAASRKPGRVELAEGGTLFLDEIGDVPAATQVKLLRVLQERELERLGGTSTLRVDVRFIAATHRDLEQLLNEAKFREDLFYRLNVIPIDVPPLRARPDDIALLARHFLAASARANGKALSLEPSALTPLCEQAWPGNVRQLENFVERLVVFSDGPLLSKSDVQRELARDAARQRVAPAARGAAIRAVGLDEQRRQTERRAIEEALTRAGDNRALAARLLGISRRTLYKRLEEFGLL